MKNSPVASVVEVLMNRFVVIQPEDCYTVGMPHPIETKYSKDELVQQMRDEYEKNVPAIPGIARCVGLRSVFHVGRHLSEDSLLCFGNKFP